MVDCDELFSYSTLQVVRVKDRRLGLLYYLSSLGIGFYIIWSIVADQLYLKKEEPSAGSIRTSFQQPSNWTNENQLSYCNTGGTGAMTGVACGFVPGQVASPRSEEGASFITTRVSVMNYLPNAAGQSCTDSNLLQGRLPELAKCVAVSGNKTAYFIGDVERFTLLIEHSVQTLSGTTFRGQDMEGTLVSSTGAALKSFSASSSKIGDILTVADALKAAGDINLNDRTDVPNSAPSNTLRYDGIVLIVYIRYFVSPTNSSSLQYEYTIKRVRNTEFKYEEPVYMPDGSLTILNRHGVRFVIKQTGYIGKFDVMQLLVNIVAATALLRVAVFIVEFFMLSVLPDRKLYSRAKIHDTRDFSDIREHQKSKQSSEENGEGAQDKRIKISSSTTAGPILGHPGGLQHPNSAITTSQQVPLPSYPQPSYLSHQQAYGQQPSYQFAAPPPQSSYPGQQW